MIQREVTLDALEHIVPTGGVRTHEARGMRKRCRELLLDMTFLLGVANEGVEVVTDDLGHTGGRDGDHLRLVQGLGVLQTGEHVLLSTEHRRVFGHRVGYTSDRLFEVTVEVGTEVGNATLRTMHVRQGLFEAQGTQYGAERLTGLGRVDGQGFTVEVQLLVLFRGGPLEDLFDLFLRNLFLEQLLLVLQRVLVLILTEQRIAGFDVFDSLTHDISPPVPPICGLTGQ